MFKLKDDPDLESFPSSFYRFEAAHSLGDLDLCGDLFSEPSAHSSQDAAPEETSQQEGSSGVPLDTSGSFELPACRDPQSSQPRGESSLSEAEAKKARLSISKPGYTDEFCLLEKSDS